MTFAFFTYLQNGLGNNSLDTLGFPPLGLPDAGSGPGAPPPNDPAIGAECGLDPLGPLPPLDPIFDSEYRQDDGRSHSDVVRNEHEEIHEEEDEFEISLKRIEGLKDEYGKLKRALLADMADSNGDGDVEQDQDKIGEKSQEMEEV